MQKWNWITLHYSPIDLQLHSLPYHAFTISFINSTGNPNIPISLTYHLVSIPPEVLISKKPRKIAHNAHEKIAPCKQTSPSVSNTEIFMQIAVMISLLENDPRIHSEKQLKWQLAFIQSLQSLNALTRKLQLRRNQHIFISEITTSLI